MEKIAVNVNNQILEFELDRASKTVLYNGKSYNLDTLDIENLILENSYFDIEIQNEDSLKKLSGTVNNKTFCVEIKDKTDLLLEKMGINTSATKKINNLKAPMPGLVLKVLAKPGDTIAKGDIILVLEAMKMENNIKAANDVVIKEIKVEERQTVEKNQVLVVFE